METRAELEWVKDLVNVLAERPELTFVEGGLNGLQGEVMLAYLHVILDYGITGNRVVTSGLHLTVLGPGYL
jgi:hypothetical protein